MGAKVVQTAEYVQDDLLCLPSSNNTLSFNSLETGRLEEAPEKNITQPSKPGQLNF